jgi:three-Cys-motif partner protein
MREWQYWTRNKLQMLEGYLPAFNRASQKSRERVYIDLMAGEPAGRDKNTDEEFDGSARIALAADPTFTRLVFCELDQPKATVLEADLRTRFPHRQFKIYPGDCNKTIDAILADLRPYRWAPTFAFIDQQAAEIHWDTICKLALHRSGTRKTELWILVSPAMTTKGVAGTRGQDFATRVDDLYGCLDWRRIQAARDAEGITAAEYRAEMVNLLRWRLEKDLGYGNTKRIPLRMPSGVPIYDMVFASDHPVGGKIMGSLYAAAAAREPTMIAAAKARAARKREQEALKKSGQATLFDLQPAISPVSSGTWLDEPCWDPATREWWSTS